LQFSADRPILNPDQRRLILRREVASSGHHCRPNENPLRQALGAYRRGHPTPSKSRFIS
jgi:hypothetical protein